MRTNALSHASGGWEGSSAASAGAAVSESGLDVARATVATGTGGVIWVGEPGTGRSRLLSEITDALIAEGVRVIPFSALRHDAVELLASESTDAPPEPAVASSRLGAAPTVVLTGDLDLLDAPMRERVLGTSSRRGAGVVVLGFARSARLLSRNGRGISVREMPVLSAAETIRFLHDDHGITVAPTVASILTRALAGNPGIIREVAGSLHGEQLLGRAALPDPLPATPLVVTVFADAVAALDDLERRALLIAAVAVVDRVDLLCSAAELDVDEVIRGNLTGFVTLTAGRFRIDDPRVRSLVHGTATLRERTDAHARLARAHESAGQEEVAEWHSSLAHEAGRPGTTRRLISLARASLRRGDSVWAYAVARQAAAQADGADSHIAEQLAGLTALESGFITDALDWLGRRMRSRRPAELARVGGAFVAAATFALGEVPDAEIRRLCDIRAAAVAAHPEGGELGADGIVHALVIAAALRAERGDSRASHDLLEAGRSLASASMGSALLVASAASWCSGFGAVPQRSEPDRHHDREASPGENVPSDRGDPPAGEDDAASSTAFESYRPIALAIESAQRGEWADAEGIIAAAILHLAPAERTTGRLGLDYPAATPLGEAHLRVTAALIDVAGGRLAKAADDLERAAMTLPVALPFAGLGVAALNRLRIIVNRVPSAVYPALVASGGPAVDGVVQRESLVDDSLLASIDGDSEAAAVLMRLANERSASHPRRIFDLPTADEAQLWLAAGEPENAELCLASSERGQTVPATMPALLRGRLALAPVAEIGDLSEAISPMIARITSLYERARTEFELSKALARANDGRARLHLLTAQHLFARAGAAPLGVDPYHDDRRPTGVGPTGDTTDPVAHPARMDERWMSELTAREIDVARGVVEGKSNRDVARALHLSVRTVETHLGRVFGKLGVRSRTQLAHLAHLGTDTTSHVSSST